MREQGKQGKQGEKKLLIIVQCPMPTCPERLVPSERECVS
ncbi:hypothetical protein GXM_03885 [Nostoc sphaeroides CCNUC1]|uniref:Uncharacterized protein n=1 Tax=Nostoc sphaeroides CCNUC1 TaxID=2653204 RepID=A0A5P8W1D0_9NOSO|nr:hypothetical protein GXM_03885 [Nostoc sphaeroides CCNUC1]